MAKSICPTVICLALLVAPIAVHAADPGHVVVVTIDGFPAYMLDDPRAAVPTIRELAKRGTVAQGMRVINPAVTWPNHTALVTGVRADRHSVMFNGILVRQGPGKPVKVEPAHDQAELVAVPAIFDILHKAGLRTAAINWPCTRGSTSLDFNWPDVPEQVKYMTPRLREELIAAGVLKDDTDKSFMAMGAIGRDWAWTAAACKVIKEHKPHFMLFHLLNVDAIHHAYGAQSNASYTAVALADVMLGQVISAIDAAGIRERTTIFVLADHGFEKASKLVLPNVILRKEKLLTAGPTGILAAKAQAIPEGGTALVYLTESGVTSADRAKIAQLFKGREGIAQVIEPDKYSELGLPTPDKNPQGPDLVLVGGPGCAFADYATGEDEVITPVMGRHTVGHHGYVATLAKMNALCVASGRSIRQGATVPTVDNISIAPTVARLLGVEMSTAAGKVLEDMLAK